MGTNSKIIYESIPYFHPGLLLKEVLETRGLEQKDFAQRTGFSEKHISHILSGKSDITPPFAEKIAIALEENAITWVNMQSEFDTVKEKIDISEELSKRADILSKYPIKDMIKHGLIMNVKEKWKQLKELMSYFGVGDINKLEMFSINLNKVRYRKLESKETKEATSVLYRWGERIATSRGNIPTYSKELLKEAVLEIRNNMCLPFEETLEFVKETLQKAGVIFVYTPKINNASASGCCYKYKNNPVIHLTYRTKQLDTFWFSLFHETNHVLDDDNCKEETKETEEKADKYAKNIIVSDELWMDFWFCRAFNTKADDIISLAKQQKVPVACIVGRLQREGHIKYSNKALNDLKEKISISTFDGIYFEDIGE